MPSSDSPYRLQLRSIISAAESLKIPTHAALCKAGSPPSQPLRRAHRDIPSLRLPVPGGISVSLLNTGCSSVVAQQLSDAFIKSIHQIRKMYNSTYTRICTTMFNDSIPLPSHRLDKIRSVFERQYQERTLAAQQIAIDHAQKQCRYMSSSKPTFHQEYVPFLEKYFEHNAYPSARDRAVLAKKSMMTSRQIEVWFQNHRNRAKKEGKTLKRSDLDVVSNEFSLDSLEKTMPFFVIPEEDRIKPALTITSQDLNNESDEEEQILMESTPHGNVGTPTAFVLTAPSHAFPAKYPPKCNEDPFPIKTGKAILPPPVWFRKPATSRPRHHSVDLDAFVEDFALKLTIREPTSKRPRKTRNSRPWLPPTYVIPSRAPHPAFVPTTAPARTSTALVSPFVDVPAPSSRLRPFPPPSPFSQPVTLLSIAQDLSQNIPPRRKVAPLPRRTPCASSAPTPARSDPSPPPSRSSSSSSRASSLDPDTSTRRISSSSSLTSSPLSNLTTPELLPVSLPTDPWSPLLGSRQKDDLFGGFFLISPYINNLHNLQGQQSPDFSQLSHHPMQPLPTLLPC